MEQTWRSKSHNWMHIKMKWNFVLGNCTYEMGSRNGLIVGEKDGLLKAKSVITRAQMAVIIQRYLEKITIIL